MTRSSSAIRKPSSAATSPSSGGQPKEALASYQEAARLVGHRAAAVGRAWAPCCSRWAASRRPSRPTTRRSSVRAGDREALGGKALRAARRPAGVAEAEAARGADRDALRCARSRSCARRPPATVLDARGAGVRSALVVMAGDGRACGATSRSAVEGYVAAAAEHQQLGSLDAALDACYRALVRRPGSDPDPPRAWRASTSSAAGTEQAVGAPGAARSSAAAR